jgi:hypothetical protein
MNQYYSLKELYISSESNAIVKWMQLSISVR